MQEIQIITTDEFEKWLRSIVDIRSRRKITLRIQRLKLGRVCRIKAEPLSDKLFSHFEHD
jgi:putative component of toxin-antitoxin plasmid stabilization module